MKKFTVIAKKEREENSDLIERMRSHIKAAGGELYECYWAPAGQPDLLNIPSDSEVILTLGGDGTLVRAASRTYTSGIPLLGVNRGHLGYLCDFDEKTVFDAIDRLLSDDYDIEERMVLAGQAGDELRETAALNDIVLTTENGRKVICLTIYVNGERLYTFNGDGVIFSTPTGSTAYNMSANGPIVDPKAELIIMTPINPHTLNTRSMILDASDTVEVAVEKRRTSIENIAVSFDGRTPTVIHPGERVKIYRAAGKIRIITLSRMNFLERIRRKMTDNY